MILHIFLSTIGLQTSCRAAKIKLNFFLKNDMTHFCEGILNYGNFMERGTVSGLIPQRTMKWKNKEKKTQSKDQTMCM